MSSSGVWLVVAGGLALSALALATVGLVKKTSARQHEGATQVMAALDRQSKLIEEFSKKSAQLREEQAEILERMSALPDPPPDRCNWPWRYGCGYSCVLAHGTWRTSFECDGTTGVGPGP